MNRKTKTVRHSHFQLIGSWNHPDAGSLDYGQKSGRQGVSLWRRSQQQAQQRKAEKDIRRRTASDSEQW